MAVSEYITGYEHIGVPTNDMKATTEFYTALGFKIIYETENNGKCIFFACGDVVVETYEKFGEAAQKRGAIDHIAVKVSDLDKAKEEIDKTDYPIIEGPNFLSFWENGVRYFSILGPNKEVVEFSQKQ